MADPRIHPQGELLEDLALARATADRVEHLRTDQAWLRTQWEASTTRVMRVHRSMFPMNSDMGIAWVAPQELGEYWRDATVADSPGEVVLLGVDAGVTYFAARWLTNDETDNAGNDDEVTWGHLRTVGALLSDRDAGFAVTAVALDNWHETHPRCARCGEFSVMGNAGWIRHCGHCHADHYPRTDPAVIMLAIDDEDRALLGRRADWQPGWFSTLAGFVEAGESAEAAVRREIAEESGVLVDDVTYLGSQPWPFPCSLMLGYHAHAVDTTIHVDGTEIVEARWFSRAELRAACEAGEAAIPPAVSIARKLIERWFGGPVPGEWGRP